jgi:hypothetical protein
MEAADWTVSSAHVTLVEASYMPSAVYFYVDAQAGPCAAGSYLQYVGQGPDQATKQANAKAVFALLLAAKLSGQTVQIDGSNTIPSGFPACVVQFVKSK